MEVVPVCVFLGKVLGAGAFGTVSAAILHNDPRQFVVKQPGDGDLDDIQYELQILRGIGYHQNVTALEFFFNTGTRIGLIFERGLCNLWDLCRKSQLTEDELRGIFIDVHAALKFIHKKGFLHCDVKPDNIIVYQDGSVKLADFGCAITIEGKQTLNICTGTTPYMAPAVLARHKYVDRTIDFWSLAVTCLEAFFLCLPFDGWSRSEVYQNIITRQLFTGTERTIHWDMWETGRFFVPRLSLQPPLRQPGSILDHPYFKLGHTNLDRAIRFMFGARKRINLVVVKGDSQKTTLSAKKIKQN